MNAEAIVLIGGAVAGLLQVLKTSTFVKRYALLWVFGISLLATLLWGWSEGTLMRETAFQFFAGWVAVTTVAAGVFGIVKAAPGQVSEIRSSTGGGA